METIIRTGEQIWLSLELNRSGQHKLCKSADNLLLSQSLISDTVFTILYINHGNSRDSLGEHQYSYSNFSSSLLSSSNNSNNSGYGYSPALRNDHSSQYLDIYTKGNIITDGDCVLLFHPNSSQYLYISNSDKTIGFKQQKDVECIFSISNNKGTDIRDGDFIYLKHIQSQQYFNALDEDSGGSEDEDVPLYLSDDQSEFKISLSRIKVKQVYNHVKSREPVRIFHREGGYVKVKDMKASRVVLSFSRKTSTSVNSIFQFELHDNENKQKEITYNQPFRISYHSTNKFLGVSGISPSGNKKDYPIIISDSEKQKFQFQEIPQHQVPDQLNSKEIQFDQFVKIKSFANQKYLHYLPGHSINNVNLIASESEFAYDEFQIKRIPSKQLELYDSILQSIVQLSRTEKENDIDEILAKINSFYEIPNDRNTIVFHQKLLAMNLTVLMEKLDGLKQVEPVKEFCQLLKNMCKLNSKIGRKIFEEALPSVRKKLMDLELMEQEYPMILTNIYRDNKYYLESLNEDQILEFVDGLLTQQGEVNTRYLELLNVLCLSANRPIFKNQQMIIKLLSKGILKEMKIQDGLVFDEHLFYSLKLYSNLSKGINLRGIALAQSAIDINLCIELLNDSKNDGSFQFRPVIPEIILDCIVHCFIVVDPVMCKTEIDRSWNHSVFDKETINPIIRNFKLSNPSYETSDDDRVIKQLLESNDFHYSLTQQDQTQVPLPQGADQSWQDKLCESLLTFLQLSMVDQELKEEFIKAVLSTIYHGFKYSLFKTTEFKAIKVIETIFSSITMDSIKLEVFKIYGLAIQIHKKTLLNLLKFYNRDRFNIEEGQLDTIPHKSTEDLSPTLLILLQQISQLDKKKSNHEIYLIDYFLSYQSPYSLIRDMFSKILYFNLDEKLKYIQSSNTMIWEYLNKLNQPKAPIDDIGPVEVLERVKKFTEMISGPEKDRISTPEKNIKNLGIKQSILRLLKYGVYEKNKGLLKDIPAQIIKECYHFFMEYSKIKLIKLKEIAVLFEHIIQFGNKYSTIDCIIQIFKNSNQVERLLYEICHSKYLEILVNLVLNIPVSRFELKYVQLLKSLVQPKENLLIHKNQLHLSSILKDNKELVLNILKYLHSNCISIQSKKKKKESISIPNSPVGTVTTRRSSISIPTTPVIVTTNNSNNNNNNNNNGNSSSSGNGSVGARRGSILVNSVNNNHIKEIIINIIEVFSCCTAGKITQTEMIFRDFISIAQCCLYINLDSLEELQDYNVDFQLSSSYLFFLFETYFNSDLYYGHMERYQEHIIKLIDSFNDLLIHMFENHDTKTKEYNSNFSKNIMIPMFFIIEKFIKHKGSASTSNMNVVLSPIFAGLLKTLSRFQVNYINNQPIIRFAKSDFNINSSRQILTSSFVEMDDEGFMESLLDEEKEHVSNSIISITKSLVKIHKVRNVPFENTSFISSILNLSINHIKYQEKFQIVIRTDQQQDFNSVNDQVFSKYQLGKFVSFPTYADHELIEIITNLLNHNRSSINDREDIVITNLNLLSRCLKANANPESVNLNRLFTSLSPYLLKKNINIVFLAIEMLDQAFHHRGSDIEKLIRYLYTTPDTFFFKGIYSILKKVNRSLLHKIQNPTTEFDPKWLQMLEYTLRIIKAMSAKDSKANYFIFKLFNQPKSCNIFMEFFILIENFLKLFITSMSFETTRIGIILFQCLKEIFNVGLVQTVYKLKIIPSVFKILNNPDLDKIALGIPLPPPPPPKPGATPISARLRTLSRLRPLVPPIGNTTTSAPPTVIPHHPQINELYQNYISVRVSILGFLIKLVGSESSSEEVVKEIQKHLAEFYTQFKTIGAETINNNMKQFMEFATLWRHLIYLIGTDDKLNRSIKLLSSENNARIGRVELIIDDRLEIEFFEIPNIGNRLNTSSYIGEKEHKTIHMYEKRMEDDLADSFIEADIDWDKKSEKVNAFLDWSYQKIYGMDFIKKIESFFLLSFLFKHYVKFKYLSFFLAVFMNIILVAISEYPPVDMFKNMADDPIKIVFTFLSVIQTLLSILMLIIFLIRNFHISFQTKVNHFIKKHLKKQRSITSRSFLIKKFYLMFTIIIYDNSLLYYSVAIVTSILGHAVSPFFFAFHVVQFMLIPTSLRMVLKALILNTKSLSMMGIFMLLTTYLMSVVSYLFYDQYYEIDDNPMCDTLLQCFLTNVFYGIPSGGQVYSSIKSFSYDNHVNEKKEIGGVLGWLIFNLIFYVIISVILLNIILGVIIDTLGELRDQKAEFSKNFNQSCFVCGIDRETFQAEGVDFKNHTQNEHNKWHYLYYFYKLKLSNNVSKVILQNNLKDFVINPHIFPIDRSISLEKKKQQKSKLNNPTPPPQ
ncbi:inositol 1 [Tieghemostelium lacteum]|uniref:Inositol 1 n=1 Tax=Tieghemostelium lacteum TaxID=361077 RepID=A0A152A870_TIELA|nr:inositol 1 [Tieghemostelium lacteum]|eukprot:KYR02325.1 inositol 1 [Tieghemostelium lacteum]